MTDDRDVLDEVIDVLEENQNMTMVKMNDVKTASRQNNDLVVRILNNVTRILGTGKKHCLSMYTDLLSMNKHTHM